ncbi:hypothetical protein CASFOL_022365 [Castilleja foliolosa]|uniref:Polygalacturonase n=1 Tax=Castilleja foliolosa TaxID=1961234 RepID=A0ABD3CV99_9LAMI
MELINSVVAILFVLPFLALNVKAHIPVIYDIRNYGATPGGDISMALTAAWKEACASETPSKIVIAPGIWTLSQAKLQGPNKAPIELEVKGTLQAYADPQRLPNKDWEWITINYVNYLTISGGGVFDGQGHQAWKQNDCNTNQKCAKLPINLSLNFINNSIIQDVTTKDSKNFHVNCISSHNVTFQRFHVSAPGESINTDGIHLARSSMINVLDSTIETGDDCISIGDQSSDYHITNVFCGPGHGISIGSLGKNQEEKDVRGIFVKNCTFKNTQNGVRVKTWPSAPATLKVTGLVFEDLIMDNVSNPVIIDQEYCPWNLCNKDKPSLIQISDVKIKNIRGTCNTAEAVTFACSSSHPCKNVEVGDVDIQFVGTIGKITTICNNVQPALLGIQIPPLCVAPAA